MRTVILLANRLGNESCRLKSARRGAFVVSKPGHVAGERHVAKRHNVVAALRCNLRGPGAADAFPQWGLELCENESSFVEFYGVLNKYTGT